MSKFSETVLIAFGVAQAAIARAHERVILSPKPAILKAQYRFLQQEALGHVEGELVAPSDLAMDYGYSPHSYRRWPYAFVQAFDTPPSSRQFPTAESVLQWLETLGNADDTGEIIRRPIGMNENKIELWARAVAHAHAMPAAIAGADLAAAWLTVGPLLQGNLPIGIMLGDYYSMGEAGFSAGGTVAIGLMEQRQSWAKIAVGSIDDDYDDLSNQAKLERCRVAWLQAMAGGAMALVRLDTRLRLWERRLDETMQTKRRTSQLRKLVEYAALRPSCGGTLAARDLSLSRQGAADLLDEAVAAGLLREITKGASFRRYQATI
jgi:hypothetical protein